MGEAVADDGSFKQASQLFDPENELLVRVFADEPLFPAERFQTPAWREVRSAGCAGTQLRGKRCCFTQSAKSQINLAVLCLLKRADSSKFNNQMDSQHPLKLEEVWIMYVAQVKP